uniref:Insulin like growth factor 2 receptor n=1 Tax=Sphenodon punctatus TaxID=8508 RepID=A0A8D0GH90_SPHPU
MEIQNSPLLNLPFSHGTPPDTCAGGHLCERCGGGGVRSNAISFFFFFFSYTWEAIDTDKHVHYKINPCGGVADCTKSSAICAYATNKTFSVGDSSLKRNSKLLLEFNTTTTCGSHTIQSNINFLCGKTLGTPEFVTSTDCVHYFEWRTFVACRKDLFKPKKELILILVPCYVFDDDFKKHDLNPLIKTSGGYLVDDSDADADLYINICRDIGLNDDETRDCPEGSAACLLKGGHAFDVGRPKEQLKLLDRDRLVLSYEREYDDDHEMPDFCNGHNPAVTITLVCPLRRSGKLTAKTHCRYEIEWVTEYACHRDYLESKTCALTSEQHDISIDLTPLTLSGEDEPYVAKDERGEYFYYLNVCGKTNGGNCRDDLGEISSCQLKAAGSQHKVAGRRINQILRYSDGDLILTYPGGEDCSSGFQRMTVINFECNETADNNGKGGPVFTGEMDCTYFFTWDTKYACVKEKEDLFCRVVDKRKRYDLAPLIRSSGLLNWEAVDSNPVKSEKKRFFINVCHKVLQKGEAINCPSDGAICSVGESKNLGMFVSSPIKTGENIQLVYSNGGDCVQSGQSKKIQTKITLVCKTGDLESAPVLINPGSDDCLYEFEWHTAAACVLSKTEGDDCKVSDSQAGFYFDLSPLKKTTGSYIVNTTEYTFYINICGSVPDRLCGANSAVCQVKNGGADTWSLGLFNYKLLYYDGMIQLSYKNGTPYNNHDKTPRSTLITFLCDPSAGIGQPEYQAEDENTYNFKWYTKHACPEEPVECVVTDSNTMEQYDLSRLSKSEHRDGNWHAMDISEPGEHKKYYINVCRPLNPVPGCDRYASVCQMTYKNDHGHFSEVTSISNVGIASKGPVIEGHGRVLLNYTNGSVCINADGEKMSYTTIIHLSCSNGTLSSNPRFIDIKDCVATFLWETEAACPVRTKEEAQSCSVRDPNSGFVFNLEPLSTKKGYLIRGNGKLFELNICATSNDCGTINEKPAGGCELENLKSLRLVEQDKTLQLSTEGYITVTYRGNISLKSGSSDTFTVTLICNDSYPGEPKFVHEYVNTVLNTHSTFFEFHTAVACAPAQVDCQVTDSEGNEYDLSDLSKENEPWIAVDTSKDAKTRTFYLNVCKPLPYIPGCPGGAIGSCVKNSNKSQNLGVIQMSPQATTDGSLSILYLNGETCKGNRHYSTRILFQCENCQVKDPRNGHVYDLKPLSKKDMLVSTDEYDYYFRVCEGITTNCKGSANKNVSSCQVKKDGSLSKIAGLYTTKLTYENGLIKINYTSGEKCHKIYERSTAIFFYCDHSDLKVMFLKETPDCTYLFEWHTPYACPPFKSIECSYKDSDGNSYDLSPLARNKENWEAISMFGSPQRYYINVCKSLVPHFCPLDAAACLEDGSNYVNLGEVTEGPRWENGISVLKYVNGEFCPDNIHRRTTIIRLKCDENTLESRPQLITAIQECEYTFLWFTAAACPVRSNVQRDCKVTNPLTGHLFDLNPLKRQAGYTVHDKNRRTIQLSVCDEPKSSCGSGVGVCITADGQQPVNAGKLSKALVYEDQVLKLVYEDGDNCPANPVMKYKSYFSFVCKSGAGADSWPVLVSFDEKTCTHYFSWHTPLACEEEEVICSVMNGSSIIDLSPLIRRTGYYEAFDDEDDDLTGLTPDFYINICQPLNPIKNVNCPPGAAVCMVPVDGDPLDIGRITGPPKINSALNEVYITFNSTTPCKADKSLNYTSLIVFHCNRGTNLGQPKMIRKLDCSYVFEWSTPIVCPDTVKFSGCSVTDDQLHYTFNLSSLSGNLYKVSSGSNSYHVGLCSEAANVPQGKCKNGAVCLVSGNSAFSFGNVNKMKMDYRHQDETVILQYTGGDSCPPVTESGELCVFPFKYNKKSYEECIKEGRQSWCATTEDYDRDQKKVSCGNVTGHREATIVFKCDENAGPVSPLLLSETQGCAVTFEWKTQAVCPPRKMECKFIQKHKTYDLRVLSSLTGSWSFVHNDISYYINLCQRIYDGPTGCPERASICRKSQSGKVEALGLVHTQKLNVTDDKVLVVYSNGHECSSKNKKATTIIELKCAKTVGMPTLDRIDEENCAYHIAWETRAACAVKPQEVEIVDGMVINSTTGKNFSLGDVYYKLHTASGDIRANGDQYIYKIQLSSIKESEYPECVGSNICQVKTTGTNYRKVGSSTKPKYYIQDDDLDVTFSSNSRCGKDKSKFASSTIFFHCSQQASEGIPEFLHETADCQYLFAWYTSAVCPLVSFEVTRDKTSQPHQKELFEGGLSGRSQAVGAVLSVLLVVLTACLLILLLYKKERRETMMHKITNCCRRTSSVSYKYTKINSEEANENETEWLMEEIAAPNPRPGKEGQENGHITKSVKSKAFTSLHVDDLDSEDEVLTIPDVKIQLARGTQSRGQEKGRQKKLPSHESEDQAGLLNGGKANKGMPRPGQQKTQNSMNTESFHDDSDEDLLNV